MRMILGLASLLIVVAAVAILAKKQLSSVTQLPSATGSSATGLSATGPSTAGVSAADAAKPASIAEQSKQMQQQVKAQLNEVSKAAADAREKALESGNTDKPADNPAGKTGSAY